MPAHKFFQAVRRREPSPTSSTFTADVRSILGVGQGRVDDRPALPSSGVLQPIARKSERPPPSSYHGGPSQRKTSTSRRSESKSCSPPSNSRALVPIAALGPPARRPSIHQTEPRAPVGPPARKVSYKIIEAEPDNYKVKRTNSVSHGSGYDSGYGSMPSASQRPRKESYGGSHEPARATKQRLNHAIQAGDLSDSMLPSHDYRAMHRMGLPRERRGTKAGTCANCGKCLSCK